MNQAIFENNFNLVNIQLLLSEDLNNYSFTNMEDFIKIGEVVNHNSKNLADYIFTSRNYDSQGTASAKDDLESFCYFTIYSLNGHLPWQDFEIAPEENVQNMVFKIKDSCTNNEL